MHVPQVNLSEEWETNTTQEQVRNITHLPYYRYSFAAAAGLALAYLFISILCMGGNGLVCYIVLKNRRMRSVTNLFILNLAFSDLLVGIFCVPTTLVDNLITGWPFSQTVCTLSGFIQGVSVSASVFTLVAIAVDRFLCIIYPFRQKLSLPKALGIVLLIWALAIAIMCPAAAMLKVVQLNDTDVVHENETYSLYTCYENWPEPDMRKAYTTVLFVHIYLAPLSLISIMYGIIGARLFSFHGPERKSSGELPGDRSSISKKKKMKVIKMLVTVAVLFMVSWLPLWTLMMLSDYEDLGEERISFLASYVFPFAHWLAFFNSSVNPIIYSCFNENFKRGFQAAFSSCRCSQEAEPPVVYFERSRNAVFFVSNKISNIESMEQCQAPQGNGEPAPKQTQPRVRGILLEEINKITTDNRVSAAWEK
ncbi:neuropeptide FF receptor 2-like [Huso huso]|uniref:Neuropeptide FF receptor 2-like n=1 Tax=Huso huso TaxID=61971 RepID=A0ABR0YA29_HUSHU